MPGRLQSFLSRAARLHQTQSGPGYRLTGAASLRQGPWGQLAGSQKVSMPDCRSFQGHRASNAQERPRSHG